MDEASHLRADGLLAVRLHRSELRESMAALEQALASAAAGRVQAWAERVHVALVELSADLAAHVQLMEGSKGLHREVVTAAPRLAGAVQRLAGEHVDLTRLVDQLIRQVGGELPSGDGVMRARDDGVSLLGRLARHRQAGADLVFEAYQVDLGGEN